MYRRMGLIGFFLSRDFFLHFLALDKLRYWHFFCKSSFLECCRFLANENFFQSVKTNISADLLRPALKLRGFCTNINYWF